MAEFQDDDVGNVNLDPSFWETRSKKAPVGSGKAYEAMVDAMTGLKKDDCFEQCTKVISAIRELRRKAKSLPMIKAKVKPNAAFFSALDRGEMLATKKKGGYTAQAQMGNSIKDDIAGKFEGVGVGEDMSDARKQRLKEQGLY